MTEAGHAEAGRPAPKAAKGPEKLPLGVAAHTAAFAHDVFNVACLFLLNWLTLINWRLDGAAWARVGLFDGPSMWAARWRGQCQGFLMAALLIYNIADITFVQVLPQSVKIPKAIVVHHTAVLAALSIPWQHSATHGYTIGIFMMADVNTMFLILRKLLLRSNSKAPVPNAALSAVSCGFYATWVVVRLILYPVWLFTVSGPEWLAAWERTGSPVNHFAVMPFTHSAAVLLNYKWTSDLCSSWLRRRSRSLEVVQHSAAESGGSLTEPLLGPASAQAVRQRGGRSPV
mmetsp:Transcript_102038/g.304466  ORF Transcript_102038/g.304466 Transcript_102038/m.304466 type:complete len:287 (-) Transcript_102038:52-912(-)